MLRRRPETGLGWRGPVGAAHTPVLRLARRLDEHGADELLDLDAAAAGTLFVVFPMLGHRLFDGEAFAARLAFEVIHRHGLFLASGEAKGR